MATVIPLRPAPPPDCALNSIASAEQVLIRLNDRLRKRFGLRTLGRTVNRDLGELFELLDQARDVYVVEFHDVENALAEMRSEVDDIKRCLGLVKPHADPALSLIRGGDDA